MSTAFRIYVSMHGLGDKDACVEAMHALTRHINEFNIETQRANHWARVFLSDDDVEEEVVEVGVLAKLTGGVYPVLWFNITFDLDRMTDQELRSLEDRFALRLFSAGIMQHNTPF